MVNQSHTPLKMQLSCILGGVMMNGAVEEPFDDVFIETIWRLAEIILTITLLCVFLFVN